MGVFQSAFSLGNELLSLTMDSNSDQDSYSDSDSIASMATSCETQPVDETDRKSNADPSSGEINVDKICDDGRKFRDGINAHHASIQNHLKELEEAKARCDDVIDKRADLIKSVNDDIQHMNKNIATLQGVLLSMAEIEEKFQKNKPEVTPEQHPSPAPVLNPEVLHDMGLGDLSDIVCTELAKKFGYESTPTISPKDERTKPETTENKMVAFKKRQKLAYKEKAAKKKARQKKVNIKKEKATRLQIYLWTEYDIRTQTGRTLPLSRLGAPKTRRWMAKKVATLKQRKRMSACKRRNEVIGAKAVKFLEDAVEKMRRDIIRVLEDRRRARLIQLLTQTKAPNWRRKIKGVRKSYKYMYFLLRNKLVP